MNSTETATEGKLVQHIITKLGDLDEDGRQRVMQTVAAYYGFSPGRSSIAIDASPASGWAQSANDAPRRFSDHEDIDPRLFILEKRPNTDVERVACLAFYLEHFREMRLFKTLDISKLNTEAAQPKFSNPSGAMANSLRAGFLAEASRGYKQLSAAGEHFVMALPDREAAKETLARARKARRKRVVAPKRRQHRK